MFVLIESSVDLTLRTIIMHAVSNLPQIIYLRTHNIYILVYLKKFITKNKIITYTLPSLVCVIWCKMQCFIVVLCCVTVCFGYKYRWC